MRRRHRSTADQFVDAVVTALPSDAIVSRESHENAPVSESAAPAYRTAEWHEREACDRTRPQIGTREGTRVSA